MSRAPWDDAHDCLEHMVEDGLGGECCAFCGRAYSVRMLLPGWLQDEVADIPEPSLRAWLVDGGAPEDPRGHAA